MNIKPLFQSHDEAATWFRSMGIEDIDVPGMDLRALSDLRRTLEYSYDRYPELKGIIKQIGYESDGFMDATRGINFNPRFFK